jgi:Secretion system C-terminal sorting domain
MKNMKKYLHKAILLSSILTLTAIVKTNAQVCEWRLANNTYSSVDPDGAGPATGSVTFTLQIHTVSGSIPNVNVISCGWSYQSAAAMIPTTPGCSIVSNPANVTVSPAFISGGFAYTVVNQCNTTLVQSTGGQTFNRTVAGTLDGTNITLTTAWVDVMTATMWTLGTVNPQGGYAVINSGAGGSPGQLGSYSVSDVGANEFVVNSLTFATPLPLGSSIVPVQYTKFDANCSDKGALISWATSSENNADYFEVQRSKDGVEWASVSKTKATGTLNGAEHKYQQLDLLGGSALYRVKQVDKNGAFTYTDIKRTNCDSKATDIVIYPVPAHDVLNVVIKSDKTASTQFIIYDGTGRAVKKVNLNVVAGSNNFPVYLNGFVSGEYIIRSVDPAFNFSRKFTVLR